MKRKLSKSQKRDLTMRLWYVSERLRIADAYRWDHTRWAVRSTTWEEFRKHCRCIEDARDTLFEYEPQEAELKAKLGIN